MKLSTLWADKTRVVRTIAGGLALASVSSLGACSGCNSSSASPSTPVTDGSVPPAESGPSGLALTPNLLLNPGAELGPGSLDGTPVASVPDWTTTGEANVVQYGASGGFIDMGDAGPPNEGMNFFTGGPDDAFSTFTQVVDVSAYASAITKGNVPFSLSGYLGGYSGQDDDAVLTVYFLSAADAGVFYGDDAGPPDDGGDDGGTVALPPGVLASASIGPATATDRSDNTELLAESAMGTVPAGTVAIEAQLVMTRYDGAYNDGYADNLSLTLGGN